ncbi:MAG: flavodoxin family protein, partial [Prolixibacteraceae bacterium]|nr:flavodoxin family protein [Prolixibacteraceae bacterium]
MYDKLIIYYFTGTGNALAVSNWIAGVATNQNISVEIRKITPSLSFKKEDISKNILIGFCYPTHGFNAPPIV